MMFQRIFALSNLTGLALLSSLLAARAAEAQNEGYSLWTHRVEKPALIDVLVPADAEIWFDGAKTVQNGEFRQFVSPPLMPGHDFFYEIKARWMENGKKIARSRRV